jgi:arylformamidase
MNTNASWRQLSQAELDTQYNARATVSDIEAELKAYRDLSLPMYEQLHCLRAMSYGSHPDETLDLFPAPGKPDAPLFVFIHGGYWRALTTQDSVFMAQQLVSQGIAVASINYTLSPAASLSHIVAQCEQALAWLHHQAPQHGLRASQAVVAGSSAGGHLAAMLMTPDCLKRHNIQTSWLTGGILVSGLFDLAPIQRTLPNAWLQLTDDDVQQLSPMQHLPDPQMGVHIVFAEKDTAEFKRQSTDFAEVCKRNGNSVSVYEVANTNHFNIILDWMKADSPLSQSLHQLFAAAS